MVRRKLTRREAAEITLRLNRWATAPAQPPGAPSLLVNVIDQTDITGGKYNLLRDSTGASRVFDYIPSLSFDKAAKSSVLQLGGYDTILPPNDGLESGSCYSTAGPISDFFPSGDGTIIAVCAVRAFKHFYSSEDFVFGYKTKPLLSFQNGSNVMRFNGGAVGVNAAAAPALNEWHVYTSRFNATEIRGQVDNNAEVVASGDARIISSNPALLFHNTDSFATFDGYFAALICWPNVLSNGDVAQAKAWLLDRFSGLPI